MGERLEPVAAEEVKAVSEALLCAAAKDFARSVDTPLEAEAAQKLFDAAIAYAWRDGDDD